MIRVYDTLDGLEDDWRRLYGCAPDVTAYQSFDYAGAALPLCEGTPHIIVWLHKGEPKAIFPCHIDSRRTLRFIADTHTDFCGPLVESAFAGDYHMCEELAEHILKTPQIRRVRLENMRSRLFQSSLQYHLKGCVLFTYRKYSFFKVPAQGDSKTAIDALSHLSTKEKYRLKNIASKMDASGVESRCFVGGADPWPGEVVPVLAQSMVEAGIRKPSYFSGQFLAFLKAVYEAGLMNVCVTFDGSDPISCNLLLKGIGDETVDWIALYRDPVSNGWNLLQLIRRMSEEGGGTLNFARGVYMYKMHNYRPALGDLDRLRYSKSVFGRIADIIGCLVEEIKRSSRSR